MFYANIADNIIIVTIYVVSSISVELNCRHPLSNKRAYYHATFPPRGSITNCIMSICPRSRMGF